MTDGPPRSESVPEYVRVERSGPAIHAALAEASPDELRRSDVVVSAPL